ncbi:MAG: twin-arginine translocase subunit TatC [Gammaproteobacteria bacterium]|nr:twin-arginine translocase subunit TatC [Gammaproteobacteria bacterium]
MANPDSNLEQELPFLAHLVELRDRLMKAVLAMLIVFLALFSFANEIYAIFSGPLLANLPEGGSMIATGVASPFLTPFKLTMVLSFYIAIPVILYQLWAFIAPGLYQHERKLVFPLIFSSIILFYGGVAFAYYVVMPLVYQFMANFAPAGVAWTPDISEYLSFALTMFFAFGVAFEVPIATIILVWTGMTTPKKLASKRPFIIVGAFVIGMMLTPPDVISQTLLALPMWILFELGVIFSRFFVRNKEEDESHDIIATEDEYRERYGDDPEPDDEGPQDGSGKTYPENAGLVFADDVENEFEQMTEEQMEAELDRIEAEEAAEFERQRKEAEEDEDSSPTQENADGSTPDESDGKPDKDKN